MGFAYQSPLTKHDVLCGLIEQCKAHTVLLVQADPDLRGMLLERFPHLKLHSCEDWRPQHSIEYDLVWMGAGRNNQEFAVGDIRACWAAVLLEGYLIGTDYHHTKPEFERAVAASFPLMRVAIAPDHTWIVQKEADLA